MRMARQRGGLISGTVTDESTGEPLADVQVNAYTYGSRQPVAETVSDENGNYTLSARDGETVWLVFEPQRFSESTQYLPYYHLSALTVSNAGQGRQSASTRRCRVGGRFRAR